MVISITSPLWVLIICFFVLLLWIGALFLVTKPIRRKLIAKAVNDFLGKLLSETYTKNLMEVVPAATRISPLNILETGFRAQTGKIITRPLGSPKKFASYDNLMFSPPQITKLSVPHTTQIDMQVNIGPKALKPMTISMPLMISAMAYGLALNEEAKIALAKAAKRLQTATCSGEGPILPEERVEAGKYVLQISRWSWGGRNYGQITSADMLEVQMGQGADTGAVRVEASELAGRAQVLAGIPPGQPAFSLPAPPGIHKLEDWPGFVDNLRRQGQGVPIAIKFMPTGNIEQDLAAAIELGFDAIVIDGAQGGSHASTPIKQDDFGIPSINALARSIRFLQEQKVRDRVSLIVAGGYFTPGNCLKALALGADAVYMATIPLLSLTHNQIQKAVPWEPPTTLVYYDSPLKHKLDIELAATNVVNTFTSFRLEMEEGVRALGKTSIKELCPEDLVALDSYTAETTGVKRVY